MNINARKLILGFLPFLMVGASAFAQNSVDDQNLFKVNDAQIREFVKEVYAHEADMVFNHEQRYEDIKDLLKNRFVVVAASNMPSEKLLNVEKFSSIELNNDNNATLKKDLNFNPNKFNPLKYNFDLYPIGRKLYQVNDKYVIIINPQKRGTSLRK